MSSWLGGHLTSFTEKITDLTKEMLPDSGNSSTDADLSEEGSLLFSPKQLLERCKEKDAEISLLMSEKVTLERSIEELDTQHQEAINELLHLKNDAVKENTALREELAAQKKMSSTISLFENFKHNYRPRELDNGDTLPITEAMTLKSLENFNLVNVFGILWKNFGEATLRGFLEWLEEQKHLLETQVVGDSSSIDALNRISVYIMFLQLMAENPKLFSPIIDEIATVIHFLLSLISENSKLSIPENFNAQSANSNCPSASENITTEFSSQTFMRDFKNVRDLFSVTPQPFVCHNAAQTADESQVLLSSQHVQTDEDLVQNCNLSIVELKQCIVLLEREKAELQEQVSEFEERVQSFKQAPSSSSALSQTENSQSESAMQTDKLNSDSDNSNLMELQVCVDILEQEKADLEDEILELQERIHKPTLPAMTQTDAHACDCNSHELEAEICILQQDKEDLLEDISLLKSQNIKSLSTVHIQTEDDMKDLREEISLKKNTISENRQLVDSLEYELSESRSIIENLSEKLQQAEDINNLKVQLNENENSLCEKESLIQSLESDIKDYKAAVNNLSKKAKEAENVNSLRNELKLKETVLQEKENVIQTLEQKLKESKAVADNLIVELEQVDKLNKLKLEEKECMIKSLQNDLEEYKTLVNNLNVQLLELDKLNEDLKSKECIVLEKENIIQSLQKDLEELKADVNNLTAELSKLDELNNLKNDLKLKESAISEQENIIESLQNDLEEYKSSLKVDDLNNLKEELKSKECIIQEKVDVIQSLMQELDEYKAAVNSMSAKDPLETSEKKCSCDLYESEILELKKSLGEKVKEYNNLQNETVLISNKLKAEVDSYKNLTAEQDSQINSANSELESKKEEIKRLIDELNSSKETSVDDINKIPCADCEKYKSEINELKSYLTEKENQFLSIQNNLNGNINNLKEILQSKDLLVINKEETIMSLKLELEEAKRNIKKHLNDIKEMKAKQDYAKDIDTMEEHDIKMIIGNCNRCKSILNEEPNDNDLKNEVKVLQDKLKALDMDKNQLLCVLNEKSQECSSLKAEVHKLTNIVASEKQALIKLQQDNCLLRETRENSDPELTKEAIQKLSGIIRDKDLEIESLKQKNMTLTTLIQDGTSVPDHLQSLIEEKENLTKQINVFKADRDKIMVRYNTVDKDCRQYAAEVKMLQSELSVQKEKFDVLEQKHLSVAQQYEEKQKSLINTQNEMIALKQRVSDLEQQQVDIKEKYSELLNKFNSDSIVQLTKDELEEKNSQIEQLLIATSEKDHLMQEKDCLIHDLSQQIKTLKLEHEQHLQNVSQLQAKVEELTVKLKEQEALVDKYQSQKEALEMRFQDKNSELGLLKDMNERLNMSLKEKEFTIQSMTEKISSLSHYISNDHTTPDTLDINQILVDSEAMFSKAQSLYKERDESLLALSQSKQENQSLRNEIQRMKSNEIHLKKELERLRMHLLEIEENYTAEALKAEEREKELRDELMEVRRRAEISNTAVVDTNQRASIQIASLQEQLSIIANQRDQALAQVSTLEDKVQQHSASVSKLQLVLEQMQHANEKKIKEREKKFLTQLEKQNQLYKELEEKLQRKEVQLEESSQALEAASRLSEQLDAKEEIIANLKSELAKTESKIKSTAQEIDTIKSNTEGKVDRVVMKSLVLGYFSTPPGQKSEVIRLLARVLDFNQEEMEKAGIVVGRNAQRNEQRGLFSSIFGRLPTLSPEKTTPSPEKSFTTLFVQFLENESQPIVPMPFPAEKMAHELPHKQHPSKKSPTAEKKNISRSNPLLLDIDSAFPTFSPVPAVEYSQSPAPSILREVLE